jgi:hypothetical protein
MRTVARQFLIVGDRVALADEELGDLGAFLIGADHSFPTRHHESGHPHQIGETGIARFGDDHQSLARRFFLLGTRAMIEPVICDACGSEQNHAQRRLQVLGEVHCRINPDLLW